MITALVHSTSTLETKLRFYIPFLEITISHDSNVHTNKWRFMLGMTWLMCRYWAMESTKAFCTEVLWTKRRRGCHGRCSGLLPKTPRLGLTLSSLMTRICHCSKLRLMMNTDILRSIKFPSDHILVEQKRDSTKWLYLCVLWVHQPHWVHQQKTWVG